MKITVIGLTTVLFSFASFAMNNGHNLDHRDQQTQFKKIQSDGITLSDFHARASIGRNKNSGIYGKIQALKTERLVSISTSFASAAELHEHINNDGVMRMRKVTGGITINPSQPLVMKPGEYHIMLVGLHQQLIAGNLIDLTLEFESGQIFDIAVPVVSIKKIHH